MVLRRRRQVQMDYIVKCFSRKWYCKRSALEFVERRRARHMAVCKNMVAGGYFLRTDRCTFVVCVVIIVVLQFTDVPQLFIIFRGIPF